MSPTTRDREWEKFEDTSEGTAIRVKPAGDSGGLLLGVRYDDVLASYPDEITDVFQYFYQTILQATITVQYVDSSKKDITRIRKT